MRHLKHLRTMKGALPAMLCAMALAIPSLASAKPSAACMEECSAIRAECSDACSAEFKDCVRTARTDGRACKNTCRAETERGTEERAACATACKEEIVAPAREACGELRGECGPICKPGNCRRACAHRDHMPPANECVAACASDFRDCAGAGKGELRECLAPCKDLEPGEEREACFNACTATVSAGREECRAAFEGCAGVCETDTEE